MALKNTQKTSGNTVEIEFSIDNAVFDKAVNDVYRRKVKNISIPGFRRGKAPRSVVERLYGKTVFYDDALNDAIPGAYEEAIVESGISPVGNPDFDIVSLDEEIVIKAVCPVKPEKVEVKAYKGLEADRTVSPVTDDEVNAEIERVRNRNAREITVSDRAAQKDDIAVIDFEGFINGKAFKNGKDEDYSLVLGSGSFIPGFEDQIIGHNAGDSFDVNVTFPKDYQAKNLAGKKAVFKTVLKEIKVKELPELDDEFAKDVSDFDTFDEYKADVKAKIEVKHNDEADKQVEGMLIEKLVEGLEADIHPKMIDTETENQLRDYDTTLRMNGLDLGTYMKFTGLTLDKMREQFRPRAEQQVKARLALEKVAELEEIEVSEDEIEAEIKRIADAYSLTAEEVKSQVTTEMVTTDLKATKAINLIKENAVITEKAPDETDSDVAEKKADKPKKSSGRKTAAKKSQPETAEPKTETDENKD